MTKGALCRPLDQAGLTYDPALPQPWLDAVVARTGWDYHRVLRQFVWLYDATGGLFGRPFPLTQEGNQILAASNGALGTGWPLNEQPAPGSGEEAGNLDEGKPVGAVK